MQRSYREILIALVTFLGGTYFFINFILPEHVLKAIGVLGVHDRISLGFVAIGLVAFGLGLINLFWIHGAKIVFARKGWINSLALLSGLVLMLIFSLADWKIDADVQSKASNFDMLAQFSKSIVDDAKVGRKDVPPLEERVKVLQKSVSNSLEGLERSLSEPHGVVSEKHLEAEKTMRDDLKLNLKDARQKIDDISSSPTGSLDILPSLSITMSRLYSNNRDLLMLYGEDSFYKKFYKFLFEGFFVSLGSAMFSLLGVYIAAAAYRAFRIKSLESSFMMLAALLVMLGQIPFGSWIYDGFPEIRDWLLKIPSGAASRAITIGASIAGLILSIRMWFSIESGSFSKDKK